MKLEQFHHQLIVSCQALDDEPLHSSFIMSRMALAAKQGGAAGIRANSIVDIQAIKDSVDLPVIGIIKRDYPDSEIYITATMKEVQELIEETKAEVIATDATQRSRPNGEQLIDLVTAIHTAGRLAMADVSNYEEGLTADRLGFDLISTTMSGYTTYTRKRDIPDFELVAKLAQVAKKAKVVMEGHTTSPEQVVSAFSHGAYTAVVGGAITRPQQITARYVQTIRTYNQKQERGV